MQKIKMEVNSNLCKVI